MWAEMSSLVQKKPTSWHNKRQKLFVSNQVFYNSTYGCCEWQDCQSKFVVGPFNLRKYYIKVICSRDFDCQLEVLLTWPWPTLRCAMSCPTRSRPIVLIIFLTIWVHTGPKCNKSTFIWTNHDCKVDHCNKRTDMCGDSKQFGFVPSPVYCEKITGKMGSRRTIFIDLNQVAIYLQKAPDVSKERLSCLKQEYLWHHVKGVP